MDLKAAKKYWKKINKPLSPDEQIEYCERRKQFCLKQFKNTDPDDTVTRAGLLKTIGTYHSAIEIIKLRKKYE